MASNAKPFWDRVELGRLGQATYLFTCIEDASCSLPHGSPTLQHITFLVIFFQWHICMYLAASRFRKKSQNYAGPIFIMLKTKDLVSCMNNSDVRTVKLDNFGKRPSEEESPKVIFVAII